MQDRALRFFFKVNNFSYVDRLKQGNILSLSAHRIRNLSMEIFKCCHAMNPVYLNDLFCKQEIKCDLRDKSLLEQPKFPAKTYGYMPFTIMKAIYLAELTATTILGHVEKCDV